MTETPPLSQKFSQLEKAKGTAQNSVQKIQRVAHYLRDRKHFAKHYSPRLVSIGPIHHGEKNLQLGEKYKLMWAARYLERTKQDAQALYQKIASNIKELKELFAEDLIEAFPDDEKLSWMLLVDGCALLQILEKAKIHYPEEMKVKVDQLVLLWQDVFLLENQLPYQVLKLLSGPNNDATLLKIMKDFVKCHHLSPEKPKQQVKKQDTVKVKTKDEDSKSSKGHTLQGKHTEEIPLEEVTQQGEHRVDIPPESPIHLLDQLRRYILEDSHIKHLGGPRNTNTGQTSEEITYRNIKELRAAGIKLKTNNSHSLRDISFSYRWLCLCAELKLPQITVDDTIAPTFLNLIAYEVCPDFKNNYEICSFVAFMDSLIDHPDDVKELRKAGVLHNALGSDEEVAKLFNTISTDLVPDSESYSHVRAQIEKHYRNKCWTWISLGCHRYFSNPWSIIAFHAAVLAILLTFIQTWFAIHPAHAG
ncbi:UPF0481 protein At3g47200 [Cajanus cajan]|uniref:UPF0481 protein At3g47200 n=1 Tax=Cajanus cajan TaxID=3821 RepID=UPI00098DB086|nr:UPF0481 protein At3g47200 [Cajanus cajan]XP_029131020.1 UPF0481 protein At3g47200 [Cajanus cajan]XP_029131021.1 UPF0481 protein At3g47200 [Cajanus cajan]